MNFAVFIPIVAILATAWVMVTIIRARQARSSGGKPEEAGENARLLRENEVLRHSVERLEKRIGVLETIATDPAERTAREIDRLRQE